MTETNKEPENSAAVELWRARLVAGILCVAGVYINLMVQVVAPMHCDDAQLWRGLFCAMACLAAALFFYPPWNRRKP